MKLLAPVPSEKAAIEVPFNSSFIDSTPLSHYLAGLNSPTSLNDISHEEMIPSADEFHSLMGFEEADALQSHLATDISASFPKNILFEVENDLFHLSRQHELQLLQLVMVAWRSFPVWSESDDSVESSDFLSERDCSISKSLSQIASERQLSPLKLSEVLLELYNMST